jgi:hypothetical protein
LTAGRGWVRLPDLVAFGPRRQPTEVLAGWGRLGCGLWTGGRCEWRLRPGFAVRPRLPARWVRFASGAVEGGDVRVTFHPEERFSCLNVFFGRVERGGTA